MSDLDVGSASPPTADVPMRVLSLRVSERLAERVQRAATLRGWDTSTYIRSLLAGATATVDLDRTVTCSAPLRELEIGGARAYQGLITKADVRAATPTSACGFCGHHAVDHARSLGGGSMTCAACPDEVCREPDHSGVAGEPEATPRKRLKITRQEVAPRIQGLDEPAYFCAPEPVAAGPDVESLTPIPDRPAAADVAGGVVVPDEAVEAFWRGRSAGLPKGEPDWACTMRGLREAAPLIAARAVIATHDRVRAVAGRLEAKGREPGGDKQHLATAAGVRLALVKLVEIADELERGTDR